MFHGQLLLSVQARWHPDFVVGMPHVIPRYVTIIDLYRNVEQLYHTYVNAVEVPFLSHLHEPCVVRVEAGVVPAVPGSFD